MLRGFGFRGKWLRLELLGFPSSGFRYSSCTGFRVWGLDGDPSSRGAAERAPWQALRECMDAKKVPGMGTERVPAGDG